VDDPDGGRRIRAYRLTPTGRKQLGSEETRWQQLSDAVNRVLKTV
jgi:DNA-binding PadR family transcriptional regulator